MKNPLIFDIIKSSFTDGPGLRSVIFFKGCSLKCPWCHNPESWSFKEEEFFQPDNCIACGNCSKKLPCYPLARRKTGRYYPPENLAALLMEYKNYYKTTKGGVTLSGGEPFLFLRYLAKLLPLLKKADIHIAVQTGGWFSFTGAAKKILPLVDLIYYDLKILDPQIHKKLTGKSNDPILGNFIKLSQTGVKLIPRYVLIPGLTATEKALTELAAFLKNTDAEECEFLPYNPSGEHKWSLLNKPPPGGMPRKPMEHPEQEQWISFFKKEYNQR